MLFRLQFLPLKIPYNNQINIQRTNQKKAMQQKPDHPHQAAVHLMKAMKCCKQCSETNDFDYRQILELQIRKEALAEQLRCLTTVRGQPIQKIQNDILILERLIIQLRDENQLAYGVGKVEIDRMVAQRVRFQESAKEEMRCQVLMEKERNKDLNRDAQSLMERIRHLHRVNNELIYNFCNS